MENNLLYSILIANTGSRKKKVSSSKRIRQAILASYASGSPTGAVITTQQFLDAEIQKAEKNDAKYRASVAEKEIKVASSITDSIITRLKIADKKDKMSLSEAIKLIEDNLPTNTPVKQISKNSLISKKADFVDSGKKELRTTRLKNITAIDKLDFTKSNTLAADEAKVVKKILKQFLSTWS